MTGHVMNVAGWGADCAWYVGGGNFNYTDAEALNEDL